MKKRIMLFIAAVVMVLPLALGLGSSLKAEAAGTVDITLHKKKYNVAPEEKVQNTGEVMSDFALIPGLPDVEFKIYDVTDDFYDLLNTVKGSGPAKYTVEEAAAELSGKPYTTGELQTETTDADGDLTFSALPDKNAGRNAVYVIVESAKDGVTPADNMVVALPIEIKNEEDDTSRIVTDIHLYPKNVVGLGGFEVEKISNIDADGEAIAPGETGTLPVKDATFVIHRKKKYEVAGVEYLKGFDTTTNAPIWTPNLSEAHPYVTDADGKVSENKLPLYDTYYLTEISVDGFAIQDGAINQEFTLDGTNTKKKFTDANAIVNDNIDVKKTRGDEYETVNVGDFIPYTVTSVIPSGINDTYDDNGTEKARYIKYEVTDTHGSHLSFDQNTAGLALSQELLDGSTVSFTLGTDYTVVENTTAGQFVVKFTAAGIAKMKPNAKLTMTYKMKLLQTAAPGANIENIAKVETDFDTDEGKTFVYTGGYNFIKVDGSNDNKALAGAEFVIRDGSDKATAKYLVVDETTGAVTWTTTAADATPFSSNASGYVTVKGLKDGVYYLQETKTPTDKYVLLEEMTRFEVTKTSFDTTNPLAAIPGGTENGKPTQVVNKQQGSLPSTGGTGIYVMVALGAVVMAAAGVWYVRSQRKEA